MEHAEIDSLTVNAAGSAVGTGSVAMRLLQGGMNVQALRTNEVLHQAEWEQYDTAVVDVARVRLGAIGDLISRGLSYPLANALGTTILQWEQASDMTDASISMTGLTEGERDRMQFTMKSLPIPIVHKDFKLSVRQLEASRRTKETLDTTQARVITRIVAERNEKLLFSGATLVSGGGTLYGMTTFPQRNTGGLTVDWSAGASTGAQIVADILLMIGALVADNMYGPYILYVPTTYYNKMNEDYKANSDRTILERALAIPGISAIMPTPFLVGGANGQVVLMQATSDVVDIVDGIQPTTVMWESSGGMEINFKVISILVPRFKADSATQCGIAHYTKA